MSAVSVRVTEWGGKWRVVTRTGSGSRGRRVATCPSREDAEKLRDAIAAQVEAGALECVTPRRVADLLDAAIGAKHNIEPGSLEAYRTRATHLKATLGELALRQVTRQIIAAYIERRLPQTTVNVVRNEVALLSAAFRTAQDRGWVTMAIRDVFSRHRYPDAPEVEWLRRDELQALATGLAGYPPGIAVACALAYRVGLRADECLHVRWSDRDTRKRALGITGYGAWHPKGRKNRVVPVSAGLTAMLDAEWERQGRPTAGTIVIGVARVECLRDSVSEVCAAQEIRRVTFHALRHTFASLALESGMDIVTVSKILGHRSINTTVRMYVHVSRDRMVDGADRMDAYLTPAIRGATCNSESA